MNKLTVILIAGFLFPIANSMIISEKNEGAATLKIGDFANGGIVFWVDDTGQHGLVCAKTDQSEGISWYAGTYLETNAREDGMLAGKKNTASIIAIQKKKTAYAALICNELQITENGKTYDDWYLPGKTELDLMFQNKEVIDATALANGGNAFDTNAFYWSSTESRRGFAFAQGFASGGQMIFTEDNTFRVRAIRSF
ncbi:MAG: hypothetical protein A2X05_06130 [Bacteroidetes bacterium GWE2_41_25]|nr:MAG: hypothetical protein A2X03_03795 [Bacteroidetes bacterium GWA2_40_15]OFX99326.1 MAG: hypothetical protein A2X06_04575 [Bacteroidetes bacterium GWC2_40_22]OFY13654.1 MAG: hypothetical protein A2X05_06130 [Bacteroidetes bacterium GWE2_41_25]OFY56861.1 MAG: hypothetical protein A2X04_04250 [Bacteroidetes bacterium GWF2_41_9]HAM08744.1 hypothetical protein [Bacteroidales bacterium]